MINVKDFLFKNIKNGSKYVLIKYGDTIEVSEFTRFSSKNGWYLQSLCGLVKICDIDKPIDEFCKEYVRKCKSFDKDIKIEDYIEYLIKPMIQNDCLYEIEHIQYVSSIPIYVDDIRIITKKECLDIMVNKINN